MQLTGKRVLIFGGKTGLLGQSLTKTFDATEAKVIPLSSSDCDVTNADNIASVIATHTPDVIINATAYTLVDQAEEDVDAAYALNATAPALIGAEAARQDILLVHYSTDFVFDGEKDSPYVTDDPTGSSSVYGASKAEGEANLLKIGHEKTLIIRISWLFGPGKMNFVEKILSLCETRDTLTVVSDQTGSPSYTKDVARNSLTLLEHDATGIYHLANSGETTWHGFASAAVQLAGLQCKVDPVPTSAYPTTAVRPVYSALDTSRFTETTGQAPRSWQDALREYVIEDLQR